VKINFSRHFAVDFDVDDTLFTGFILELFYFSDDFGLGVFIGLLEFLETLFVAGIFSCTLCFLYKGETFVPDYFYCVLY
jgi:hypothetical protein